jgi:hypothetical protein
MPRRTVRKPTRRTAEEWARVTDAARPLGIPALRFVREAALEKAAQGTAPAPPKRRHPADQLAHQLARVLNNPPTPAHRRGGRPGRRRRPHRRHRRALNPNSDAYDADQQNHAEEAERGW